jgi:hypothetical protein
MIPPPVIILGMHRSGTSILTSILKDSGVFMGHRLGGNVEALFFQLRNDWLLRRAGGAWDNPLIIKSVWSNPHLRKHAIDVMRRSVASQEFSEFTKYFREAASLPNGAVWGWKDPRTIFTLELWLEIFPTARLVYISRNGIDVAASLRRRARLNYAREGGGLFAFKPLLSRLAAARKRFEIHPMRSARCCSLEESFSLWEEYSDEAHRQMKALTVPTHVLRFEDFVKDPVRHLAELLSFCRIDPGSRSLQSLVSDIKSDRGYAFLKDQELTEFYVKVKDRESMKLLGYDTILS